VIAPHEIMRLNFVDMVCPASREVFQAKKKGPGKVARFLLRFCGARPPNRWRNIAIARFDPDKGEEKAQSCENAC